MKLLLSLLLLIQTAPSVPSNLRCSLCEGSPVAVTRRQAAIGSQADPSSATFASTPLEGSLLVAILTERSGGTATNHTLSGSGWTRHVARTVTDLDNRRTLSVWSKVAGASEPTNVTGDDGTANTKALHLQEFSADASETFTFLEKQDNDNDTTDDANSISSGTTASVSSQNLLVVTALMYKSGNAGEPNISWSNSLADEISNTWSGFTRYISTAYKTVLPGSGTFESTATDDAALSDNDGLTAAILVFGIGAPAAAVVGPRVIAPNEVNRLRQVLAY